MKKVLFGIITAALFTVTTAFVPGDEPTDNGNKQCFKRLKAYFRYKDMDYNGALRIYREVYQSNKNDAKLTFQIGQCYVQLQNMEQAMAFLNMSAKMDAANLDPLYYFHMGQAYQYLGKLDSAIYEYNLYKSGLKARKLKNDPVVDLLSQAETAKAAMENPVTVMITNLGADINSEYDDGMPAISADGSTLIFTSRRPDTKGSGIDPNTGQFFDDIYMSTWNDSKGKWNVAASVEGDLNTTGHDACLGVSPDGNTIFVYRNIPKETGSGDIFSSTKRADGKWGSPKTLDKPVNSSFFEGSCSESADGNVIFFISERKGGKGNADIWRATKIGKTIWGKPVNLGGVVNSIGDEATVFMHPNGKTLFFSSNGHKTMGGYDIFVTQMNPDSSWTVPVNLGYPINSTKDEKSFVMTADGKKAYISSSKDNGTGGYDLYEVDMSNYIYPETIKGLGSKSAADSKLVILKGSVVESSSAQQVEASVVINDAAGKQIAKLNTNEAGEYFVTLKGDIEYTINVVKEGYKDYSEKVTLPYTKDKTNTIVKLIMLQKQ